MKLQKAKKVLLILAGIFGLLAALGMLVAGLTYSLIGAAYFIGVTIYGIISMVQISKGSTVIINDQPYEGSEGIAALLMMIIIILIIIVIAFTCLSLPGYLGFILLLIGAILAFIGSKKNKKGTHIASIIFSSLALGPAISYFSMAWVYTCLAIVVLLLFFTPAGWLGAGLIVGFWGTLLTFILSLLGNIFGLVAIRKEKQLEEQQVEIQEVK